MKPRILDTFKCGKRLERFCLPSLPALALAPPKGRGAGRQAVTVFQTNPEGRRLGGPQPSLEGLVIPAWQAKLLRLFFHIFIISSGAFFGGHLA